MTNQIFMEILNAIRSGRRMLSNSFLTSIDIEKKLCDENTKVFAKDGLLAFLSEEEDFVRLTYYSDGEKPLLYLPPLLQSISKTVVADVVGRELVLEKQSVPLEKIGFVKYSTFVRMSANSIIPFGYDKSKRVVPINREDAESIVELLKSEFDPVFAHIPHTYEITSAIEKGEVLGIYDGSRLAGLTFLETISSRLKCLRYYIVRPNYRGRGFGGALLMNALSSIKSGCSCYLWIGTYNKTSALYNRIGFKMDGLVDNIMIFNKENI